MRIKLKHFAKTYTMQAGNFKPLVIAISTAFSAMIYTKKRWKKESRLRAMHSKASLINQDYTKKN